MIDYLEGTLSKELSEAMALFLEEHPQFSVEEDLLTTTILPIEEAPFIFPNKASLKKEEGNKIIPLFARISKWVLPLAAVLTLFAIATLQVEDPAMEIANLPIQEVKSLPSNEIAQADKDSILPVINTPMVKQVEKKSTITTYASNTTPSTTVKSKINQTKKVENNVAADLTLSKKESISNRHSFIYKPIYQLSLTTQNLGVVKKETTTPITKTVKNKKRTTKEITTIAASKPTVIQEENNADLPSVQEIKEVIVVKSKPTKNKNNFNPIRFLQETEDKEISVQITREKNEKLLASLQEALIPEVFQDNIRNRQEASVSVSVPVKTKTHKFIHQFLKKRQP